MMKIAAICETHFVGIVPHFTGPIATAALVNSLGTFSGPVMMEYNFQGRTMPHLPRLPRFQKRQAISERASRSRRRAGYEAAQADHRNHAADHGSRPDLLPSRRIDHELVSGRA